MLAQSRNKFPVSLSQEEEDLLFFSLSAHVCPEWSAQGLGLAQVGPAAAPAPLQGGKIPSMQCQRFSPTCIKLAALLHCRAPGAKVTAWSITLEAATGPGVQAAIAGCMWVGLEAFVLHAALQALCLLRVPSPARPGMLCCTHHHGVNHTPWQLQIFNASCTPLLSLFSPILAEKTPVFFPLSLAVALPGFSCPTTAAEQSCPHSPMGLAGCAGLPKCSSKPRAGLGWAALPGWAEVRRGCAAGEQLPWALSDTKLGTGEQRRPVGPHWEGNLQPSQCSWPG